MASSLTDNMGLVAHLPSPPLALFYVQGHRASLNISDAVHIKGDNIPLADSLGPAGESGILVLLGSRDLRLITSADRISVGGWEITVGVLPDIHLD